MELSNLEKELVEKLKKLSVERRFAIVNEAMGAPRVQGSPPGFISDGGKPLPGVQYVVGPVPGGGVPVLRPLRQPIFDKLIFEPNGQRSGEDVLFTKAIFPNGVSKQPGVDYFHPGSVRGTPRDFMCIGFPGEFDFRWLELHVAEYKSPEDVRAVMAALKLEFIFGQVTPWLTLTGDSWTPLIVHPPSDEKNAQRATAEEMGAVMKGVGKEVWPAYYHDFRGNEGKPRRICSTEVFRMNATWENLPPLKGRVVLKVMMQDTYYAQL